MKLNKEIKDAWKITIAVAMICLFIPIIYFFPTSPETSVLFVFIYLLCLTLLFPDVPILELPKFKSGQVVELRKNIAEKSISGSNKSGRMGVVAADYQQTEQRNKVMVFFPEQWKVPVLTEVDQDALKLV